MTLADETNIRTFDADMRERLEGERAELLAILARGVAEAPLERSDVSDGPGETEFLATAEHHELTARVEALTRASLAEIDAALARVEDGSYGRCATCSSAIPQERLDVMPAASHCVTCQQQVEGTTR